MDKDTGIILEGGAMRSIFTAGVMDFFLEKKTNKVIFNEINTLPGFTPISMYPMLFEHAGYSTEELVDKIVELGLKRYEN